VIYAALLGNLLGAVVGILATRRIDREFPFGPALVGGWVVVVLLAQTIST
jgi:prepilin signal peptidase PulO-like enzyme (type II secretory pathway)